MKKTKVDIMMKIPKHYDEERVSLSALQLHVKAKCLRDQMSGQTRTYQHHDLQQSDAVLVVLDP